MNKPYETVTVSIDNRTVTAPKGATILAAARQNGVYIPTLCAHKDLTPYGGCRMCIVEVEKMRGFPTSCTTPVEDGMVIRTHTAQLQSVRAEILRLILSEHPSSCLICDEHAECRQFMGTIRKAGVTTGCRWCANDGQCELQEVVEWMGITDIGYSIYYRNLRVEKEDPFYDRDYNLCILCGRCIRVCQQVRAADTLAFKQRGRFTVIGPAFKRTHLEAGCEFCGACVEVCPTGTLSEKTRKWYGKAERETVSTCALCGVGCQVRLQIKGQEVIGVLPADDQKVNNAQLCVKGRFCVPELVNNYQRLKRPYQVKHHTRVDLPMEEAISLAAARLSTCTPDKFGMILSPTLGNEDLYVAQKFVRSVMHTHGLDNPARLFYGQSFNGYLDLLKMSAPLAGLPESSVVVCVGLDTRYARSVVGVELRNAIRQGAKIITIHPRRHNLVQISDLWLKPTLGQEPDLFNALTKMIEAGHVRSDAHDDDLSVAARMLRGALSVTILFGTEFFQYHNGLDIVEAVVRLAHATKAGVLPLPAQNNLVGSILMGAFPEFLPGGGSSSSSTNIAELNRRWRTHLPKYDPAQTHPLLTSGERMEVLYTVGEMSPTYRDMADYLIAQNIYPPEPFERVDLALPAAAFTETNGSFISGEGRVQRVRKAVDPPGEALPDWDIICRIARQMGAAGFDFTDASEIYEEISDLVPGFTDFENPTRSARPLMCDDALAYSGSDLRTRKPKKGKFPLTLTTSNAEHVYRGFPLARWVAGMSKLVPEGVVAVNRADAAQVNLKDGDQIVVASTEFENVWPALILEQQEPGTLHIALPPGEVSGANPYRVTIRRRDV
jgi:formate dehydrogenase alpha subunit